MASWLIALPLDTIKSIYQSSTSITTSQMFLQIRQKGFLSLYHGLSPALLRAFPASAGFFAGVEMSNHAFTLLS